MDQQQRGLSFESLKRMIEHAVTETATARAASERDRDYYDGFQWTPSEVAVLNKRKQPVITINRIRRKVDSIVGLEQKGRVDPKALPRTPDDEQSADVATKALVFVDDITRFDAKRSQFCYDLAIYGYGGVEVVVKDNGKGQLDPDIERLRWEEIIYDPHSREADFSDAALKGVQKWMDLDAAVEFCRRFVPDMPEEELAEHLEHSMEVSGNTYEDRPMAAGAAWGDKKKKRVRLAYVYYRCHGVWYLCLLSGSGELYNEPSPYLDDQGKPACAIILQSCYVDRENRRSGVVRDMISPQDEVNKRRSKILHMLQARQTKGHAGAIKAPPGVDPIVHLKRELALPDGHVEYDQDPTSSVPSFDIIPQVDQIAGQFQLLQESKAEIDMLGPNASLHGQLTGEQSGRAIMAQQQAGYAEMAPFYDALRDWTLRVYRAVWCRIRQFWTEPRWIRVTGDNEAPEFVGLNLPMIDQSGMIGIDNEVAALDVDIIVDMTPEHASLQQEEFVQLVELAKSGMVQIPPDVLIEASQLRNKGKLLEMYRNPQAQQQAAQQAEQQARGAEAQIAEKEASAGLKQAQAQKALAEIGQAPEGPQGPDLGKLAEADFKRQKLMVDARQGAERLAIDRAVADAGIRKTYAETEATRVRTMRELRTPIADPNKPRPQAAR